ncbi:hypothetical protein DSO57_1032112 [Entomophthora muscae]|uniref:Uncharacterized protein n=1 Tax=Entomophthora muscae TaxID=34485 RepID=A0ACC2TZ12_9FUNG|nr:hypothetical protein DSO57_1032112 [Entomophthora muscae]
MTLPLTLRPNCPMETPTAANTMSTQLFGHPSYGGNYPPARLYSNLSQPMPLPMPGSLTQINVSVAGGVDQGLVPASLDGLKGGGASLYLVAQENLVSRIQAIPGVKKFTKDLAVLVAIG